MRESRDTRDATLLTVGEVSQRTGVSVSALRFYEGHGLIWSSRTSGNQRRYTRDMIRRVALIHATQGLGISLDEVKRILSLLPEDRTPKRADWECISAHWKKDLDARIRQLEQLRDQLSDCIGCGCLSLERCALVNPQDVMGSEGRTTSMLED
ncbi:redox-sensitive transcriptional activator SoxR [Streptomyces massasporeus]|uniref:Redox-sensitive transcriptional activator SoxR n=1 Tax=Streptomyces massasporeus TaxID=67324 RepID=A0ABW6LRP3_9ACTN